MDTIVNTPSDQIPKAVNDVKAFFRTGETRSISWRKAQLKALLKMIEEKYDELKQALKDDLGVNDFWTECIELNTSISHVKHTLENIDTWSKARPESTPLLLMPGSSYVQPEPLGTVLFISPWNYPLSLVLIPMASAIAAGNCFVLKPSELSPYTSNTLEKLLKQYLDTRAYAFVQGDKDPTTVLLKEKFDLIFYTGNGQVARIIAAAAAKYLTPTVLELGGKSPAIFTPSANIKACVKRVVWGKFSFNVGQTCISPDYIITTPDMVDKVTAEVLNVVKEFYTEDPKSCTDVSRIINERHTERLKALLDDPSISVLIGGEVSVKEKFVAPTVVRATPDSKCMQSEIFGPILPIVVVESVEAILDFINSRDKPLAMYLFSDSKAEQKLFVENTSSGGLCLNDSIMHATVPELPFGGVGESGMGAYHGKFGFDTFAHLKAVYRKGSSSDPSLRFPPYTANKVKWMNRLNGLKLPSASTVISALVAVVAVGASIYYVQSQA